MGPEAKLWKTLKPLLEKEGCMTTRIENRHGGGLPDVCVASPYGTFMIELKIVQKISVGLSDMQIAYNTLLNHKNGLSFILAEVQDQSKPLQNANPFLQIANFANKDQEPIPVGSRTKARGSGTKEVGSGTKAVGSGKSGRGQSGRGPRTSVGSGRDRYHVWHGRDAVDVGRVGLRAEVLASGSSLSDLVQVMLAVCWQHHAGLLGKGPGR